MSIKNFIKDNQKYFKKNCQVNKNYKKIKINRNIYNKHLLLKI